MDTAISMDIVTKGISNASISGLVLSGIDGLRTVKYEEINNACATEIISGFSSDALGATYKYDSDIVDQINIQQATESIRDTQNTVLYKVTNSEGVKEFYSHTYQQLKKAMDDGVTSKLNALARCASIKSSIATTESIDQLNAIHW